MLGSGLVLTKCWSNSQAAEAPLRYERDIQQVINVW